MATPYNNNNNTTKVYDNSPQAIRTEAIKRAKKEFSTVLNTFRACGVTPEQVSDDTIRAQLVAVKETFMINARQKHIADPFAQFELKVEQVVPVVQEAVVAPAFNIPQPAVKEQSDKDAMREVMHEFDADLVPDMGPQVPFETN